jgi:hypothetical protein
MVDVARRKAEEARYAEALRSSFAVAAYPADQSRPVD